MKVVAALIAAMATFLATLVLIPGALIIPASAHAEPGTTVGWDPISFFHHMGWMVLMAAAAISILIFFLVYRHLSQDVRET
ncbi:MAG: hypothetical protein ROO76_13950 [Terriglobia bacterium]|jgi:uncharacterized membrane protein YdjX (TVP38/TMEM64 family)|nr:hypothetical protein [Terriglobia bacterium]